MNTRMFAGALAGALLLPGLRAEAAVKQLSGHVPAAARARTPTGRLPSTNLLTLAIGLPLHNQAGLESFLRDTYNPASPQYRHYLSPAEFTERFGPSPLEYHAVIQFARNNHLQVVGTCDNRVLLDVRGAVADIERAFGVHLLTYYLATEGREFFAPDTEPSVDETLSIQDVSGLDNYGVPHPMLHPSPLEAGGLPAAGSGPGGAYLGLDFRRAYAPGVSLTGAGQTVGLLELEGYYASDIAAYEQKAGLPNVPLINVQLDGFSGPNSSDSNGVAEASLDIELAIAMATGLTSVVVFEAPNSSAYWNDLLNSMAASNQIKQFSSSWGYAGGTNATTTSILLQMGAQGQSFFQASGDGDAWTGAIWQPADNPYLTSVGGTTLTMNGSGASYASETVWNQGYDPPGWSGNPNGYVGSGGGVSTFWPIPNYQQPVNMQTNKGSTVMRNIPDVALTASQIWVAYEGTNGDFGGTSCAAPLWAGYMALINQQAAQGGRPSAGFINPAIYSLGQSANYTSCLHDVTTGNNTNSGSDNLWFACPGYDLCTGWGTPSGLNLINALASPDALGVQPGYGFSSSGNFGGPFNTNSITFTLTNSSSSNLFWVALNTAPWLSMTNTSGRLGPDASTNVTVILSSLVTNLPPGTYNAFVIFSNTITKFAQPRQFTLTISPLQLIQDGGFSEGNSFAGWTLSGDYAPYTEDVGPISYENLNGVNVTPQSGDYMAILNTEHGSQASLSQAVTTTAGQPYLLSYWINGTSGSTPNYINALWNGAQVLGSTNLTQNVWDQMLCFVTATGATSTVQFNFYDVSSWIALDTVSLEPVAFPQFLPLTQTNGTLYFQFYAQTGLVYQLQYRTNLVRGSWVNLGSSFTASNLFNTLTDSTGAGPQRFYRLVVMP